MAGTLTISIDGTERIIRNIRKTHDEVLEAVERGFLKGMFLIKADSVRFAPIDTSNLRASHYVMWKGGSVPTPAWQSGPRQNMGKLREGHAMEIGEGRGFVGGGGLGEVRVRLGVSAWYAAHVHEARPGTRFKVGGRKFLEKSINKNRSKVITMIIAEIKATTI